MNTLLKLPILLLTLSFFVAEFTSAQQVKEVTGKRLYEHHSPAMRGLNGRPDGGKSGYDFVKHDFISSFDPATFSAYTNGEEEKIDMVEHNGPYSKVKKIGITSGYSSIWVGDIVGNRKTKWVVASANFDYSAVTTVEEIEKEFNSGSPDSSVEAMTEGTVYIAKIRETKMYVAMRCYNVTNSARPGKDVYFDFDYKYGTRKDEQTGIESNDRNIGSNLVVYPNPASNTINLKNNSPESIQITITNIQGQVFYQSSSLLEIESIDISNWKHGTYFIHSSDNAGELTSSSFIKK